MAYTITAVSDQVRQWASEKAGPMNSYRIDVRDSAGVVTANVELAQKAATPAPHVGQVIEGNIDNTQYGLKFKKAFSGGGGGAPRGKSPEESAAIQRMHLQKTAPVWVEFLLTIGVVSQPADDKEAFALMTRVMDWLEKDITRAKGRVAA